MENSYKYQEILILSYFKEHISSSSFTELSEILGLSILTINQIVTSLCKNELLKYDEKNLLTITSRGYKTLVDNQSNNLSFDNIEIMPTMATKTPISINDTYIPKNFIKKIKPL